MSDLHQSLQPFYDGQLSVADADAFRTHLGTCEACQHQLHELMQLDASAEAAKHAMPVPQRAPQKVSPLRWLAPFLGLAAAAGLTVVMMNRSGTAPVIPTLSGPGGSRHLEARVSWDLGDAYRPYDTVRGSRDTDEVPLETLVALEKKGDHLSLAGAWLLSGDSKKARALLKKLEGKPDVSADLAAVALAEGRPGEALELAQLALDENPKHTRALWNKALAARELGFPAVAAEAFGQVAALGEKGWALEASQRQQQLDAQWKQLDSRYQQALGAGEQMALEQTPMPAELVAAAPSMARLYLAHALRTAQSREKVEGLLPVARQLDLIFGGTHVEKSVRRAADASFTGRPALSKLFRAHFVDNFRGMGAWGFGSPLPESELGSTPEQTAALVKAMVKASDDDVLFGLPYGRQVGAQLERYQRAAKSSGDPFFVFQAQNELGKRAVAEGRSADAEREFLEVAQGAEASAPYRAMQAHEQLALLFHYQHRGSDAELHAMKGLSLARAQGDLQSMTRLWQLVGDAARYRNLHGLTEAALKEHMLRRGDRCEAKSYYGESMGSLALFKLDPNAAREALKSGESCGAPLSLVGAFVLADVIRMQGQPADRERLAVALKTLRENGHDDPTELAMFDQIEGRAELSRDAVKAEGLLRRAIAAAKTRPADDSQAKKVVAYSYGALRAAAGEAKKFDAVLQLVAEERGQPLQPGCALAVEVQDDRVAVAVRNQPGAVTGAFARVPITRRHRDGLDVDEIAAVVSPLASHLAECTGVAVYAGFPLNGRTGWLPDSLPWSFASGLATRVRQSGPSLVVSDVEAPASLGLPRLAAWSANGSLQPDRRLQGTDATPERVLSAMRDASFVELDAHGLVNPGSDETAQVVLAPSAKGYGLTATMVKHSKLERHPLVLLGACRAATVAPSLHEEWSLPRAFLDAGASAVIAAPVDLPDAEAKQFFGRLTSRLQKEQNVAAALRDERVQWLKEGRGEWVRAVLLFD